MIHTDSAIRFRFGLTPLEEVKPWGAGRVLHWFGLTAGWYCIDIGGHEVLRYSERTVRELRIDGDGDHDDRAHPYVDHYVVRLWEDVIALVSGAMEPVPHDLVEVAADISPRWTWIDTPEADAALTWHGEGHLYTDYLRVAPAIRLWRTVVGDEDTVTVAWEHRADPEGVIEFASPQTGRVTVPTPWRPAATGPVRPPPRGTRSVRAGTAPTRPPHPPRPRSSWPGSPRASAAPARPAPSAPAPPTTPAPWAFPRESSATCNSGSVLSNRH
ncbi:DUF5984 family protein, partial [Streptomyces antarcticus]|uniref:DUF5984 family protein n=1 Tax=Streptomyces antarcticus TaxID=2996458 RepID=UPI0022B02593